MNLERSAPWRKIRHLACYVIYDHNRVVMFIFSVKKHKIAAYSNAPQSEIFKIKISS